MATVGIIEQHYHSHIAYYYATAANAAGHDVTLYVTETGLDRIEDGFDLAGGIEAVVRDDDVALSDYRPALEDALAEAKTDFCTVNTVNGDPEDFIAWSAFRPPCPWGVGVYGMKRWFGPQPIEVDDGDVRPAEEGRRAFEAAHRHAVLHNASIALAQYSPWLEYLAKSVDGLPIPVYHYPYVIHDPDLVADYSPDRVEVAVPGAVKRRRDYHTVVDAVESLWTDGFDDRLTLSIVGRAVDDYAIRVFKEEFKRLHDAGWPLRFFDRGWLPREFYDDQLRRADVFIAPMVERQELRGYEEVIGRTHGTGVVWDAIRHATPLVLPEHFAVGDELGGVRQYDGVDGLQRLLRAFVTRDGLLPSLHDEARRNASAFALERQAERFDHLLETVGVI